MVTKSNRLKGKRVLITSGPTWVSVDAVRVISNIATGATGILLAREAKRRGAKPTLILGPVGDCCLDDSIEVIHFKFFEQLKKIISQQLKAKKFDLVIHAAAVSDFKPVSSYKGKVGSGRKSLNLKLVPTEKLVKLFKKIQPKARLVIFKLELGVSIASLLKRGWQAKQEYKADVVVANTFYKEKYRAFILKDRKMIGPFNSRDQLSEKLIAHLI